VRRFLWFLWGGRKTLLQSFFARRRADSLNRFKDAADGRLVVTVETTTDRESSESFGRIGALPGVMSVSLVYHQFEPETGPETDAGSPAESTESTDAPEEARHDC